MYDNELMTISHFVGSHNPTFDAGTRLSTIEHFGMIIYIKKQHRFRFWTTIIPWDILV